MNILEHTCVNRKPTSLGTLSLPCSFKSQGLCCILCSYHSIIRTGWSVRWTCWHERTAWQQNLLCSCKQGPAPISRPEGAENDCAQRYHTSAYLSLLCVEGERHTANGAFVARIRFPKFNQLDGALALGSVVDLLYEMLNGIVSPKKGLTRLVLT